MKSNIFRTFTWLALVISILAAGACEKIIDIDIPDSDRKIVINGLLNPDSLVKVQLSKSLSILEEDEFVYLPGAVVNLFHGPELIGRMEEDSAGYYVLRNYQPAIGETYRLTAEYEGLEPVESTTTIPSPVTITSLDTASQLLDYGQRMLKLKLKFDDPGGESNFYGLSVYLTLKLYDYINMRPTDQKYTQPGYLANTDPFLSDEGYNYGGRIFFNDVLFDGTTKALEVGLYDLDFFMSDTVWLDVQLEQVEKPYYQYIVTNQAYQAAHNNPFSEPVQVYTNITGGFGIFSSYSSSSYPLILTGRIRGRN